jgi:hypothetical protein
MAGVLASLLDGLEGICKELQINVGSMDKDLQTQCVQSKDLQIQQLQHDLQVKDLQIHLDSKDQDLQAQCMHSKNLQIQQLQHELQVKDLQIQNLGSIALQRGEQEHVDVPCNGWQSVYPGMEQLYRVGVPKLGDAGSGRAYGNYSLPYLWHTGALESIWPSSAKYSKLVEFAAAEPVAAKQLHEMAKHCMGPLYFATGSSLCSTSCTGTSQNGSCLHCSCLQYEESIKRRARSAAATQMKFQAAVTPDDWHDILGKSNVSGLDDVRSQQLMQYWQGRALSAERDSFHKDRKIAVISAQLGRALEQAQNGAEHHNYPKLLQNLIDAFKLGRLEVREGSLMNQALHDILTGVSITLKNATTDGRPLTSNEHYFYAALLNGKGPWAQVFVSQIFNGPHLQTSKKFRSALCHFYAGWGDSGKKNMEVLVDWLTSSGLEEAPLGIVEDASTLLRGLDLELVHVPSALTVRIWGLTGPKEHIVHSVGEMKGLLERVTHDMIATYMYAWVVVPAVDGAPWLPVRLEISNNRFDRFQVWKWWREMDAAFAERDLLLCFRGSDGDGRLRAAMYYLMREHQGDWLHHRYGIDHNLFNFLQIAVTVEGLHLIAIQDYMHLIWRLRVLLLKQNLMHLGPGQLVSAEHLKDCPFLKTGDLDYHNKQNWGACQRLFSLRVFEWMTMKADGYRWEGTPVQGEYVEDWHEDAAGRSRNYEPQMAGTACYLYFGYSLMTCWLKDGELDPDQIIDHAAYCMAFVLYWRYWLQY